MPNPNKPFLEDSFKNTNFDIKNSEPAGGPINDPASGFEHVYGPNNTYLYNVSIADPTSPIEEITMNDGASTGLDLTPDEADGIGGPNRTNAVNIASGQYINSTAGGKGYIGGTPGSEINTVTLHQYTPNRTYMDVINNPDDFPEPNVDNTNNGGLNEAIPTDVDESIVSDVGIDPPNIFELNNF